MKLKMKEWMEKMTKAVKPATCTEVTLPFTPPCNGLLIGLIRAGAQGRFYVQLTNAMPGIIDAYQTAAGYCVEANFVTKNKKVEQSGSSNILQTVYYFIPLVGGVLRNPVISRLTAIFTSLLFGGDVGETEAERAAGKDCTSFTAVNSKDEFDRVPYRQTCSHQNYKSRFCLHIGNNSTSDNYCNTCGEYGLPFRWIHNHIHGHRFGLGLQANTLTISERRWAA